MLLEGGIESFTMEGLAARAGVNKALPYYYFETPDNLLQALGGRAYERVSSAITATVESRDTFADQLEGLLETWLDHGDSRRILAILGAITKPAPALQRAQHAQTLASLMYFATMITNYWPMPNEDALVLAGALMSSSQAMVPTLELAHWSRRRTIRFYARLFTGAIEASAGGGTDQP